MVPQTILLEGNFKHSSSFHLFTTLSFSEFKTTVEESSNYLITTSENNAAFSIHFGWVSWHIMGSLLSIQSRPKPAIHFSSSPLLRVPPELIFAISHYLAEKPESLCSLAVTCKQLYLILVGNGWPSRLKTEDRFTQMSFLCLLERDLGNGYYLCPRCVKLHTYNRSWGPTSNDTTPACSHLYPSDQLTGPYSLAYHHVRLVMNNHLFGAKKGIPLRNLEGMVKVKTSVAHRFAIDNGIWRQKWSALIIDNELFLQVQHILQARDESQLMETLHKDVYDICPHTVIHRSEVVWPYFQSPTHMRGPLTACQDVPGSCETCLTDFTMTIEPPPGGPANRVRRGPWRILVTTYHRLGEGRSPCDWKWRAFAQTYADFTLGRGDHRYPPGGIRKQWNAAHSGGLWTDS